MSGGFRFAVGLRFGAPAERVDGFRFGASKSPPPVVTLVSPAQGNVDPSTPIVVDVTDVGGFHSIIVTARLPLSARNEVVYDGVFDDVYGGSTRAAITNGFRFTIRRNGGWPPGAVDLKVRAVDTDAQEI